MFCGGKKINQIQGADSLYEPGSAADNVITNVEV